MFISEIPQSIIIAFIISLVFPLAIFSYAVRSGARNAGFSKKQVWSVTLGVFIFFVVWFLYTTYLAVTGMLYGNSLPPKPLLFLIFPLILLLFILVKKIKTLNKAVNSMSIETLINIHVFRLIGGWFLIFGSYGLLPSGFALRTGIGDIITAISAILLVFFVLRKKVLNFRWLHVWNVFGLVDILLVLISAVFLTIQALEKPTSENNIMELTLFPFVLIPAFAPASIIFLHILTFKKLKTLNQ